MKLKELKQSLLTKLRKAKSKTHTYRKWRGNTYFSISWSWEGWHDTLHKYAIKVLPEYKERYKDLIDDPANDAIRLKRRHLVSVGFADHGTGRACMFSVIFLFLSIQIGKVHKMPGVKVL